MILNSHAQIVIPQLADPNVLTGVILLTAFDDENFWPWDKLSGIKIPHPSTVIARNILRHILKIRRKTVASSPMRSTKSCSFVFRTGATHASIPFPIGGGACFSSAIFNFGEYTMEL
jgi:hypothetical protein